MKKKNLKGFTLVEVVIALAIFAIVALLVSTMYVTAAKISIDSAKLNNKADHQLSKAEGASPDEVDTIAGAVSISFKFAPVGQPDTNRSKTIPTVDVKTYKQQPVDLDGNVETEDDPPDIYYFKLD